MLYISGQCKKPNVTEQVYDFFTKKYTLPDVEVYYCDLSSEGALGFQEKNGDEFLIHIDSNLTGDEHIRTLFHELVHCTQDIRGVKNDTNREQEAYQLEEQYTNELMLRTSKLDQQYE